MVKIALSEEGSCAQSRFCFPVHGKKEGKDKWIANNDLFVNDQRRVFALVNTETQVYFMDAVTGSLYRFDKCLSSDTLQHGTLRRNQTAGARYLAALVPTLPEDFDG